MPPFKSGPWSDDDKARHAAKKRQRRTRRGKDVAAEYTPAPIPDPSPEDGPSAAPPPVAGADERSAAESMREAIRKNKLHRKLRDRLIAAIDAPTLSALPRENLGDELIYRIMRRIVNDGDEKMIAYVADHIMGKPTTRVEQTVNARKVFRLELPPLAEAPVPKALAASLASLPVARSGGIVVTRPGEVDVPDLTGLDDEQGDGPGDAIDGDFSQLDDAASSDDR